jgi:hypothetical protein
VKTTDEEELARRMFAAYNTQAGGLTWDGKPIPPWHDTGPKVQANWCAAAREALAFARERLLPRLVSAVFEEEFVALFKRIHPEEPAVPEVLVVDDERWVALDMRLMEIESNVSLMRGRVYEREMHDGVNTWRLKVKP